MRNRCLLQCRFWRWLQRNACHVDFAAEAGTTEHEGVSLKPQMLVQFGGFGITNSMLVTWIVAAGIIVFSQIATRQVKAIPSGFKIFGSG
jgi:F0F1-type ATP synthase membrane subunit a